MASMDSMAEENIIESTQFPAYSESSAGARSALGIATPSSSSSSRNIVVEYGWRQYSIPVPDSLYPLTLQLRDGFTSGLRRPDSANEPIAIIDISSNAELLSRFMSFVMCQIEDGRNYEPKDCLKVLEILLTTFELWITNGNDVHAVVAALPVAGSVKLDIIKTVVNATHLLGRSDRCTDSVLFRAAEDGRASIFAVFGGQGTDESYFNELGAVYTIYEPIVQNLFSSAAEHLRELIKEGCYNAHFSQGINFLDWLKNPPRRPHSQYITSAPVSFPLIGLLQLAHYKVVCHFLGRTPSEMHKSLSGTTGHSQGIVVAAVVAAAEDWQSFQTLSMKAIKVLLSTGVRSQEKFSASSLHPSVVQDALDHGEGSPTPMLSVRLLSQQRVRLLVREVNSYLPVESQIELSLVNGSENVVLTGPPMSLHGFNVRLRAMKASPDTNQARIPFSQRKPTVSNKFLPISVPFHSSYLSEVAEAVDKDVANVTVSGKELCIPVYATNDGEDLRLKGPTNIVPHLVRMITEQELTWAQAVQFPGATHIIDFGPGRLAGAGSLINQIKQGTGVRILLAGSMGEINKDFGYMPEIFDRDPLRGLVMEKNWGEKYAPKLIRTATGNIVDTKLSRLLGLPPVMVAGMTPTTVSWEFVAATMNAGYHIELATGGYHNAAALNDAILRLADAIPPGRGITCNIIYANPHAVQWQMPLIKKLKTDGIPIDGLTFGAGVPSLDVANGYIQDFGLKHISFKPGSLESIQRVIAIAKANPKSAVILQWTGGRSGGHHSFEDFHQPIIQMYSSIRSCDNIILVAGSGMGDADGSYPYLTGEWARQRGLPLMPFDGILLGSRVMVAKETKTSLGVKQAIVNTAGVEDSQWEQSYQGCIGGVISVISEMGEPIHKLATRGVQFWSEMDKTIFNLEMSKRVAQLHKRRDYIIRRLNADFQKVWFGKCFRSGEAVDLAEMTYSEVILRLIELTFVKHEHRWIDKSFRSLTYDFILRAESRFTTTTLHCPTVASVSDLDTPYLCVQRLFNQFQRMTEELVSFQDVQYFISLCKRRGQKPVPFVPALDENFETWFKKDSLWQSEDLEAVVDQDVGRVCILQGPVAVRYSKAVDEPIKHILDGIHLGHVEKLRAHFYAGQDSNIPVVECFGVQIDELSVPADLDEVEVSATKLRSLEQAASSPSSPAPDLERWLKTLGGNNGDWRQAFFTSKTIVQNRKIVENPVRRLFDPVSNMFAQIDDNGDPKMVVISLIEDRGDGEPVKVVEVRSEEHNVIILHIMEERTANNQRADLILKYSYRPEVGFAPIHEIMEDRNARIRDFYHRIWFGDDIFRITSVHDYFHSGPIVVTGDAITQLACSVDNFDQLFHKQLGEELHAPMDFAIVAAWKPLIQPLFSRDVQGDLLKLVHLSNGFRMIADARPIAANDVLETKSHVTAVINQGSGKLIEVHGRIFRDHQPIMEVTSQFLYRGTYDDYESTFKVIDETPMEVQLESTSAVAILKAKKWLHLRDPAINLLHKKVSFRLKSIYQLEDKGSFRKVETTGVMEMKISTMETLQLGSIEYSAGRSHGNPVISYLERHGQPEVPRAIFDNPVALLNRDEICIEVPLSNEKYARASGDFNPIHVSKALSQYVGLPGTITHGMFTSGRIRGLIEKLFCASNVGLFKSFHCSFTGMVLPGDSLRATFHHVGMVAGRKIIKVVVAHKESNETVLVGEAEVEAPKTAYLFTGQGSQETGMGMDLYATSDAARNVWDRADKHFFENYGKILNHCAKAWS